MIIKPQMQTIGYFKKYSQKKIKKEPMFHRAKYSFVKKHCGPIVQKFIKDLDKTWLIDVRLHKLQKGERPAIAAWHLDFYQKDYPMDFENRMVVIGDCSLPEFVTSDLEVDDIEPVTFLHGKSFESRQIKEGEIVSFTATDYHRATPAIKFGYRLFIRATNCTNIKEHNEMPKVSFIYGDESVDGTHSKKICYFL